MNEKERRKHNKEYYSKYFPGLTYSAETSENRLEFLEAQALEKQATLEKKKCEICGKVRPFRKHKYCSAKCYNKNANQQRIKHRQGNPLLKRELNKIARKHTLKKYFGMTPIAYEKRTREGCFVCGTKIPIVLHHKIKGDNSSLVCLCENHHQLIHRYHYTIPELLKAAQGNGPDKIMHSADAVSIAEKERQRKEKEYYSEHREKIEARKKKNKAKRLKKKEAEPGLREEAKQKMLQELRQEMKNGIFGKEKIWQTETKIGKIQCPRGGESV